MLFEEALTQGRQRTFNFAQLASVFTPIKITQQKLTLDSKLMFLLQIRSELTLGQLGNVYWVTGLSGSGKTTIGERLYDSLKSAGRSVFFLDGDVIREVYGNDLGHTLEDRRKIAMRNSRLCKVMAEQGFDVVCATISLFHSIQKWNRENIPNYLEIYLRSPLSTLEERDPKGIYARARNGELKDVVGIDLAFEEPQTPDIVLENDGRHSVNSMFEHLSHEISKRALR